MITNFETWLNENFNEPNPKKVVVSSEVTGAVEKHKEKILAAVKSADPTSKAEFYPATGKIVGVMNSYNLRDLSVALRRIDANLKAVLK